MSLVLAVLHKEVTNPGMILWHAMHASSRMYDGMKNKVDKISDFTENQTAGLIQDLSCLTT